MNSIKDKLLSTNYFIDNEYLDKYVSLMLDNRSTIKQKGKTERHHILQRSYFKEIGQDCDNSKDNLINLLYKDHILAHYYLCLCTVGAVKKSNILCFNYMINYEKLDDDSFVDKLDYYQQLHEDYCKLDSQINTGKKYSEETCRKKSLKLKGQKRSEETKQKMRKPKSPEHVEHIRLAQLGKIVSEETKENIKKAKSGVHWYTDGNINRQAKICPEGFRPGRTQIISEEQKEKIRLGRKKFGPWNKGKKLSEEHRKKLSEAKKGKEPWNKGHKK